MDIEAILATVLIYAVPVLSALAIIIIGFWIAGRITTAVRDALNKAPNSDPSLSAFLSSLVRFGLIAVIFIAALTVVGIDTSSIIGMILGLSVAAAFILQYPLSDVVAGIMLILFRPFKLGDEVEINGEKGVITDISLTATVLKTRDNVKLIIGSGQIWGGIIRNHTALEQRRLDMDFGVSYDADIDVAIDTILSVAKADPRVHAEPAPWAKVVKLNESSVDIQLRAWCDYDDLRGLKVSISQPVKAALDKAGIGIPYPHSIKIRQNVKSSKARDRLAKLQAAKLKNS